MKIHRTTVVNCQLGEGMFHAMLLVTKNLVTLFDKTAFHNVGVTYLSHTRLSDRQSTCVCVHLLTLV